MELIFNKQYFKEVMADLEYDADKLPLGKLSKRTLEQGYTALKVSVILFDLTISKNPFAGSGQSNLEWRSC
jgi:poly [ADP-ribose] polymerase